MNSRDYKHIISSIKSDDKIEGKIAEKILEIENNNAYTKPLYLKIIPYFAVAAILVALMLSLTSNNTKNIDDNNGIEKIERTNLTDKTNTASIIKSISKMFTVIAYTDSNHEVISTQEINDDTQLTQNMKQEAIPVVLEPLAEIPLAKYSPAMSSVPGLPFVFELIDSDKADKIKITIDNGDFLKWDIETGKITNVGKEYIDDGKFTLYWTPLSDSNLIKQTIINISVIRGNDVIRSQIITLKQIDELGMYYTASAGEVIS